MAGQESSRREQSVFGMEELQNHSWEHLVNWDAEDAEQHSQGSSSNTNDIAGPQQSLEQHIEPEASDTSPLHTPHGRASPHLPRAYDEEAQTIAGIGTHMQEQAYGTYQERENSNDEPPLHHEGQGPFIGQQGAFYAPNFMIKVLPGPSEHDRDALERSQHALATFTAVKHESYVSQNQPAGSVSLNVGAVLEAPGPSRLRAVVGRARPRDRNEAYTPRRCSDSKCHDSVHAYQTRADFNHHIRRKHTSKDKRPHKCDWPSCTWRFVYPKDVVRHVEEMHLKLRYRCPVSGCPKHYINHDGRVRHMIKKHFGVPLPTADEGRFRALESGAGSGVSATSSPTAPALPQTPVRRTVTIVEPGEQTLDPRLRLSRQMAPPTPPSSEPSNGRRTYADVAGRAAPGHQSPPPASTPFARGNAKHRRHQYSDGESSGSRKSSLPRPHKKLVLYHGLPTPPSSVASSSRAKTQPGPREGDTENSLPLRPKPKELRAVSPTPASRAHRSSTLR